MQGIEHDGDVKYCQRIPAVSTSNSQLVNVEVRADSELQMSAAGGTRFISRAKVISSNIKLYGTITDCSQVSSKENVEISKLLDSLRQDRRQFSYNA